ncbi:DUF445 family protein [Acidaminobacter sp. JC074]|uniref:DUF445 domain-containing protein n=1 Tax=Acidaminobacter sp. JC074 TaxID=2530199 RepID=UPI001F0F2C28|nr:DUF445 family protein [Acidaminobacter sp. JC074]MCH4889509.1 DUF445 family protein [Acidaminobacter sp. JC074]
MDILLKIILMAFIGAVIGYTTNVVAIKLLFKPLEPINILGFKLQGVIPKRRDEIAKSIAETVEAELLSVDEIMDQLIEGTDKKDILEMLKNKIISMTEGKLPGLLSAFSGTINKYIEDIIDSKGEELLDEMTEVLVHKATSSISISKMVEEKISGFELDEIETMILKIAKNELRHIEILGGVLGFLIGITQGLLFVLF